MSDQQQIEVTETATKVGTVKFGLGQLAQDNTPLWATMVFRVYLYIAGFTIFAIPQIPRTRINAEFALELVSYIGLSILCVHGLSKMLGIDTKPADDAVASLKK